MSTEPRLRLRPARSTDAGKIGEIITESVIARTWKPRLYSGAEDIAHAGAMIDRGWVTVALAEDDRQSTVVGFLARDGEDIHALFIAQAMQGLGVGQALMEEAQAQVKLLKLWTFAENRGAQRFYERMGFEVTGHGDGSDQPEGLPTISYHWELGSKPKPTSPRSGNSAQALDAAPRDNSKQSARRGPDDSTEDGAEHDLVTVPREISGQQAAALARPDVAPDGPGATASPRTGSAPLAAPRTAPHPASPDAPAPAVGQPETAPDTSMKPVAATDQDLDAMTGAPDAAPTTAPALVSPAPSDPGSGTSGPDDHNAGDHKAEDSRGANGKTSASDRSASSDQPAPKADPSTDESKS